MRTLFRPHPFKIYIIDNKVFVNAGKVYCFYNPLNFKKVRWDASKSYLPNQPIPLSLTDRQTLGINDADLGIQIPSNTVGIDISLFASFSRPEKWVPANFYIPIIKKAWIVLTCFKQNGDFTIIGKTKNEDRRDVKYEAFDPEKTEPDDNDAYFSTADDIGNAWNLCLLGQAEFVENNWNITQCINKNFPITPIRNIWPYLASNTNIYNFNISNALSQEQNPTRDKQESSLYRNPLWNPYYTFLNSDWLDGSPTQFTYINVPNTKTNRGHIVYTDLYYSTESKAKQLRFPTVSASERDSLWVFKED